MGIAFLAIPRETEERVGYYIPWNSLREKEEDIVKSCSCVRRLLRERKDSATRCAEIHREIERNCCKAYHSELNRRSNSCGRSYQRVVNHVKPVCYECLLMHVLMYFLKCR